MWRNDDAYFPSLVGTTGNPTSFGVANGCGNEILHAPVASIELNDPLPIDAEERKRLVLSAGKAFGQDDGRLTQFIKALNDGKARQHIKHPVKVRRAPQRAKVNVGAARIAIDGRQKRPLKLALG